jgi:hypothetical protein
MVGRGTNVKLVSSDLDLESANVGRGNSGGEGGSGRREYLRNPGAETLPRSSVKLPIPSMADLAAQLLRAREERGGLREEGCARVSHSAHIKMYLGTAWTVSTV